MALWSQQPDAGEDQCALDLGFLKEGFGLCSTREMEECRLWVRWSSLSSRNTFSMELSVAAQLRVSCELVCFFRPPLITRHPSNRKFCQHKNIYIICWINILEIFCVKGEWKMLHFISFKTAVSSENCSIFVLFPLLYKSDTLLPLILILKVLNRWFFFCVSRG